MEITQKLQDGADPCPYLPELRALMNRMANSNPVVYEALKPELDEVNGLDVSCAASSSQSPDQNGNAPPRDDAAAAPKAAETGAAAFDVRYSGRETRSLTDEEFAKLRSGLRYDPPTAAIAPGGSATTVLKESDGSALVTVTVRWPGVVRNGAIITANFHVTMQNSSNCLFSSNASFLDPSSAINAQAISFAAWSGWVTLHEPSRGETTNFDGAATLGSQYPSLVFRPDQAGYSLTQCRTPIVEPGPGSP